MDVNGELRTANATASTASSSIAALTGELEQLVERLEADWWSDRQISPLDAEDLHDLRVRAERLLATTNQPVVSPTR